MATFNDTAADNDDDDDDDYIHSRHVLLST